MVKQNSFGSTVPIEELNYFTQFFFVNHVTINLLKYRKKTSNILFKLRVGS